MDSNSISFDLYHPKPLLVVISGTSGIGKDAVVKGLMGRDLPFHFVVTATSRAPRKDEVYGKDYFFFSKEEFEARIVKGEFIEYAVVYDQYKGVLRSQIDDALKSGKDVVMRLDVQGSATIRKLYPEAILIFLIPNNKEEWIERLMSRESETAENLQVRIETAKTEVAQINLFDYVVVNAENLLEKAVDDIISIINCEHHKINHRKLL